VVLQRLIARHPEVLAGDDAAHRSLILVRREAGVREKEDSGARWALDHLYLDAKGIPTLVEVKRSSDTRSRREVVAQMLDYAAHARASFSAELLADWLTSVRAYARAVWRCSAALRSPTYTRASAGDRFRVRRRVSPAAARLYGSADTEFWEQRSGAR
jgi:hypothetical protein